MNVSMSVKLSLITESQFGLLSRIFTVTIVFACCIVHSTSFFAINVTQNILYSFCQLQQLLAFNYHIFIMSNTTGKYFHQHSSNEKLTETSSLFVAEYANILYYVHYLPTVSGSTYSNISGKRILVTGGNGYIGSHTCIELLDSGAEIVIVDR